MAFFALTMIVISTYAHYVLPLLISHPFRQDYAQDYLGARALLEPGGELYPVLTPAFEAIGLQWAADHRSTHPPTAFLLAVPFAGFDYRLSTLLWVVVMFGCIVTSARVLGLNWKRSGLAAGVCLAWPPTVWSLYQFTPIWLLGLALAYRFRGHPLVSGAAIGLASLPKYLAAPALLYHLVRRQWSAAAGFSAVWLAALGLVVLLRPDVISTYLASNTGNSLEQIGRPDNAALAILPWRLGGWAGLAAAVVLILWVWWSGLRRGGDAGWACFVWLGVALLPIAWIYSLLPLLPWLVQALRAPGTGVRVLAGAALLAPYGAAIPALNPWFVTLSIALAGLAFAASASMSDAPASSGHAVSLGRTGPGRVLTDLPWPGRPPSQARQTCFYFGAPHEPA